MDPTPKTAMDSPLELDAIGLFDARYAAFLDFVTEALRAAAVLVSKGSQAGPTGN